VKGAGETQVAIQPLPGVTTIEQARNARVGAWAYVFKCWDAKKGEQHDLTTKAAAQAEGANQGRKGYDSDVCC
jgi:hypothetical protein